MNTSSTRVELRWNPAASSAPDDAQRALLLERLATRLDGEGWLRLTEQGSRSQLRNREAVTERFVALVSAALKPRKSRRPTRVPRGEKERRLEHKRRRSGIKDTRRKVSGDE